jgi:uncharacterized protein YjbJ (UPF0337 family)
MNSGAQDKIEGRIHVVKGKVKELAGQATDDPDLEDSGTAEKTSGKVQEVVGRVKSAVGS